MIHEEPAICQEANSMQKILKFKEIYRICFMSDYKPFKETKVIVTTHQ